MQPIVAYYRVSTERQGRSALGLDAQCERCAVFAAGNGMNIVGAFTEVETGIREIRASGVASLRGIADVLNKRGVRTARGGRWAATQVSAVLARAAAGSPEV